VIAYGVSEATGVGRDRVDEQAPLRAVAILDPALTLDQTDAAQSLPALGFGQGAQCFGDSVAAHF
jgi:hypothetical protein